MGRKEFEEKCKKEGHKPGLKSFIAGVRKTINVTETEFILRVSICGAICKAKGQWDNPID